MTHRTLLPLLLALALLPTCDRSGHSGGDDDEDTGADADTDTDTDADTDTGSDAGTDGGDTDTYEDCGPQHITDGNTGLTWWRCHAGGWWEWVESGCACVGGIVNTKAWHEVQDACDPDWRPATAEELMGVLEGCDPWEEIETSGAGACDSCASSEPCGTLFPSDEHLYWSATEAGVGEGYSVGFDDGAVVATGKDDEYHVRCVAE